MKKKDLKKYFLTDNQSGYKTRENHVKKQFPDIYSEIINYHLNNDNMKFNQKLYNYLYNIKVIPNCLTCEKEIKWRGVFSEGYKEYCNLQCGGRGSKRINNIKKTVKKKYGEDWISKTNHFSAKKIKNSEIFLIEKFKIKDYKIVKFIGDELEIKHPDGHIFTINRKIAVNRFNGNYEISNVLLPINSIRSTYEIEIENFIKTINVDYIKNDRKLLKSKELDFYLYNDNIAIEFNGLYWHSSLYIDNKYHLNKTEECNSLGIKLIHIFEDEWIEKTDIIKSIIKSKLGIIKNKIYGRKCKIIEISSKDSKEFLEKNHIQGNINSSVRIGLYNDDELVSLMTFGKKRGSLGSTGSDGEYEMYRFCNILNTTVIGGASKLFKYFLENYRPKEVISYADRRYFDGGLYLNLGFTFTSSTKPNYWYITKNHITKTHRYNYRKDKLVKEGYDPLKTEKEIMSERGYLKIYDCGNLKFKYIN